MSTQWKLDKHYAKVMENHPYGIALYRPQHRSLFGPGSCGYFDNNGSWNPIVHLEDTEMLKKKGLFEMVDVIERAPVDTSIRWGPLTSANTKAVKVELSGGIDPAAGIPLTASAVYSYSVDDDVGAILLTSDPITHEYFYHTTPFKNWCKKNALTILSQWPEVKENGFWIVTSVHSTKKCAMNIWKARKKGFKVGFSAEVGALGKLGPSGDWYRSQADEGWAEYSTKEDDKFVVFFGGLKFQYTWFLGKQLKLDQTRGETTEDEDEFEPEVITTLLDPANKEASIVVDCEEYLVEDEIKQI